MIKKNILNPYILFLPFLVVYILYIIYFQTKTLSGDEIRHFNQALLYINHLHFNGVHNIEFELRNGPGYPLLLAPFIAMHVPLLILRLFNALFLYLSVVFLFKSLVTIVSTKRAILFSIFWGVYLNSLEYLNQLYSEKFAVLLVVLAIFFVKKTFENKTSSLIKNKFIWLSGMLVGYLILTKIIFGYVVLIMFIGCICLWLFCRVSLNYKKSVLILLIAIAVNIPYLIYTFQLTGQYLYWGSSGGDNLYWMSTTAKNEYGSWMSESSVYDTTSLQDQPTSLLKDQSNSSFINGADDSIRLNHKKDIEEVNKFSGIEKDEAFKKLVIRNIKTHPLKYLENCFSNLGRIFFNFPYSYSLQKPATLLRLPFNGIIVVASLFCLFPTIKNWFKIDYTIKFILFIAIIYLGGSIFGSAETRMFTLIAPIIIFWIAYITEKSLKISFDW